MKGNDPHSLDLLQLLSSLTNNCSYLHWTNTRLAVNNQEKGETHINQLNPYKPLNYSTNRFWEGNRYLWWAHQPSIDSYPLKSHTPLFNPGGSQNRTDRSFWHIWGWGIVRGSMEVGSVSSQCAKNYGSHCKFKTFLNILNIHLKFTLMLCYICLI